LKEEAKLARLSPYTGKAEAFARAMDWRALGAGILLRIQQ
jgi:hypothetical protein